MCWISNTVAHKPLIYEVGGSGGTLVEVDIVLLIHERRGGLRNGWDIGLEDCSGMKGEWGWGNIPLILNVLNPPRCCEWTWTCTGINQPKVHGQSILCVSARERTCYCSCSPIRQSGKLKRTGGPRQKRTRADGSTMSFPHAKVKLRSVKN